MKLLTEGDKYYLAALVDGEGTICASESRGKIRPNVSVYNTSFKLVEWCQRVTGIGSCEPVERGDRPRHKRQYQWRLRQDEMRAFLPVILPYLKIKARQAELLLELLETLSAGGKGRVTDDLMILRLTITSELSDLNRGHND